MGKNTDTILKEFKLKELELNALLEVTQSINNNLPEESLYRIYNFTLRSNLNIKKAALFVKDEDWACKVNFGTQQDFYKTPFNPSDVNIKNNGSVEGVLEGVFDEFDKIIPVFHKDHLLAVVFIGEFNHDSDASVGINLNFIEALSNIIIVAIENKKLARKEMEQKSFQKELEIARNVQQFLFPKNLPNRPDIRVYSSYLPHRMVGGDYFDYIEIEDGSFMICIADVSGKGIPAALMMSNFQASLRTLVRQTTKFERIIRELNYQVLQNNNGESFITFFAAIYNKADRYFKYVNAGHNPPFFYSKNTGLIQLESGTTVLGVFHPLPFLNIGKIRELDAFSFFSFTDGLIEAFNAEGEPFGTDRLLEILRKHYGQKPEKIHAEIINAVKEFSGQTDLQDDITLLSCQVT